MQYCPNCKQPASVVTIQWDAQGVKQEGCKRCIHQEYAQEGIMHTKFCDAPKGYGGRFLSHVMERKERDKFIDYNACPSGKVIVSGSATRRKVFGVSGFRR